MFSNRPKLERRNFTKQFFIRKNKSQLHSKSSNGKLQNQRKARLILDLNNFNKNF